MDVEAGVTPDEVPDHSALVGGAAIPEQDHRPPEMAQEVPEEPDDLHPGDVDGVEVHIQPQATIRRRDGEAGDGGNAIAPVAVPQEGRAPLRRPGLADIRDEQKPAFVEEREMGSTPLGVFLYGAR